MKLRLPHFIAIGAIVVIAGSVLYRVFLPYDPNAKSLYPKNSEVAVAPAAESRVTATGTFDLAGNEAGWQAVGRGPVAIMASGRVDLGGGVTSTPMGTGSSAGEGSPAPELPQGMLLAKIGLDGKPFKCHTICRVAVRDNIYLTINDTDYTDNSGAYTVTIKRPGEAGYPE